VSNTVPICPFCCLGVIPLTRVCHLQFVGDGYGTGDIDPATTRSEPPFAFLGEALRGWHACRPTPSLPAVLTISLSSTRSEPHPWCPVDGWHECQCVEKVGHVGAITLSFRCFLHISTQGNRLDKLLRDLTRSFPFGY